VRALNVTIVEKKMVERMQGGAEDLSLVDFSKTYQGFVLDVNLQRHFGFVSLVNVDDDAPSLLHDKIFFHLSSVTGDAAAPPHDPAAAAAAGGTYVKGLWVPNADAGVSLKKGDEISCSLENKKGKLNGVSVAKLDKGTIKITHTEHDLNKCCQGIVLLEPSYTTLAHTPNHGTSLEKMGASGQTGVKTEGRCVKGAGE
jgi:hypothetical protein